MNTPKTLFLHVKTGSSKARADTGREGGSGWVDIKISPGTEEHYITRTLDTLNAHHHNNDVTASPHRLTIIKVPGVTPVLQSTAEPVASAVASQTHLRSRSQMLAIESWSEPLSSADHSQPRKSQSFVIVHTTTMRLEEGLFTSQRIFSGNSLV